MTTAPECEGVLARFLRAVAIRGRRVAMRRKRRGIWQPVSWTEYGRAVETVAGGLHACGLNRGDRIAVFSSARPEWAFVEVGAQGAGVIPLILSLDDEAGPDAARVLSDCRPRVVFVEDHEQLSRVVALSPEMSFVEGIICFDSERLGLFDDERIEHFEAFLDRGRAYAGRHPDLLPNEAARQRAGDVARLSYVADGPDGVRGVMLTHGNMLSLMHAVGRLCPGEPDDEQLSILPAGHIFEFYWNILRPLDFEVSVDFAEGDTTLVENLREVSPSAVVASPGQWEELRSRLVSAIDDGTAIGRWSCRTALRIGERVAALSEAGRAVRFGTSLSFAIARILVLRRIRRAAGLDRARVFLACEAPLSPELTRWFRALGVEIAQVYGKTECSGCVASDLSIGPSASAVGKAVSASEVLISSEGEILVRGPHVFAGYFGQSGPAGGQLRDGWYHTGHSGSLDKEGYLTVNGPMNEHRAPVRHRSDLLALGAPHSFQHSAYNRAGQHEAIKEDFR